MAGSLIKIDEEIVTSAVATITVGGANWDSSYDVYMVKVNNLTIDTNGQNPVIRFLDSSNNPVTSANYNWARKILKSDASFGNGNLQNATLDYFVNNGMNTTTGQSASGILYLFNFNNTGEYSFYTVEEINRHATGALQGLQGGGVLKLAAQHKGVEFGVTSGNYTGGSVVLYGLKK
jgi:hypothetical protein